MKTEEQIQRVERILDSAQEALQDMRESLRDEAHDSALAFVEAASTVNECVNNAMFSFVESLMRQNH